MCLKKFYAFCKFFMWSVYHLFDCVSNELLDVGLLTGF